MSQFDPVPKYRHHSEFREIPRNFPYHLHSDLYVLYVYFSEEEG